MCNRLVFGMVLLLPSVAFAQGLEEGGSFDLMTMLPVILAGLVAVASAISAIFPSVGKVMKLIDFIALNWGKARNDPGSQ